MHGKVSSIEQTFLDRDRNTWSIEVRIAVVSNDICRVWFDVPRRNSVVILTTTKLAQLESKSKLGDINFEMVEIFPGG